jgi:hypothetical protein
MTGGKTKSKLPSVRGAERKLFGAHSVSSLDRRRQDLLLPQVGKRGNKRVVSDRTARSSAAVMALSARSETLMAKKDKLGRMHQNMQKELQRTQLMAQLSQLKVDLLSALSPRDSKH